MRFSSRSKLGILPSFVAIAVVVGGFMVTFASAGTAYAASTSPTTASYQGTTIKSHLLATTTNFGSSGSSAIATAQQNDPRYIPYRSPGRQNSSGAKGPVNGAPQVSGSTLSSTEGTLSSNFDGLSDSLNKAVV